MEYADTLREHGMRVTAARLAVLSSIDDHPHSDADQIRVDVQGRLGSISGQAVYDALNALTKVEILRRVEPAGVRARYEFNHGDNHHHIICRRCGLMDDMDCQTGHAPCLQPSDSKGWRIDEAEVFYWGTCPACQEEAVGKTA